MSSYFDERNDKTLAAIDAILDTLPDFAREFNVGISMRTMPLTRLGYLRDIRVFCVYLTRKKFKDKQLVELQLSDIASVTPTDVETFIDWLSSYTVDGKRYACKERAKERKVSSLRAMFKYFYKKERLTNDVMTKVDTPKTHLKPIIRLDVNEVVDILDEAESGKNLEGRQRSFHKTTAVRDEAMLSLFLGTGIRISECVGLDRKDINFDDNSFVVTRKGGNTAILFFSEEVAAALRRYLEWLEAQIQEKTPFGARIYDKNALFVSSKGGRMTPRAVELMVKKYAKAITPFKKITPHKLRSTYGTNLYRETHDIFVVADVLGHKDVNTTRKHYAAMSEDIRRDVVDKVKLRDRDKDDE
ncbi:MAG: tyrosine-type recombinase/integrase [Clostridia bacterium]|nr:tyrosine-type recombinase/integrase [Clostridia bacterium]MCI9458967.1 tyrosine-type recombinase/integrase [Clostridia bacterium]